MSTRMLAALVALAAAGAASAQTPAAAPPRGEVTPTLRYASAFADYRAYEDVSVGDWRAQNDRVRAAAAARQGQAAAPEGAKRDASTTPGDADHAKRHGGGK